MKISKHAEIRSQQRGISKEIKDIIFSFGSRSPKPGNAEEYRITKKVSRQLIADHKKIVKDMKKNMDGLVFNAVPKKILNPNFTDISLKPIEISIREKIGYVVSPTNLVEIPNIIKKFNDDKLLNNQIKKIRSETVYHIGNSAEIGSKYIQELIS